MIRKPKRIKKIPSLFGFVFLVLKEKISNGKA